ncbi:type II secretion system protein J [Candidatus Riflebacteria bacterium]
MKAGKKFTLLEIMVAFAIMSLLVTIVFSALSSVRKTHTKSSIKLFGLMEFSNLIMQLRKDIGDSKRVRFRNNSLIAIFTTSDIPIRYIIEKKDFPGKSVYKVVREMGGMKKVFFQRTYLPWMEFKWLPLSGFKTQGNFYLQIVMGKKGDTARLLRHNFYPHHKNSSRILKYN